MEQHGLTLQTMYAAGSTTNKLTINSVTNTMNGYKYRVKLDKIGNSCGLLSNDTTLIVYTLPTVNNVTIIQCDDDLDAVTTFNLTVKMMRFQILQMKPFLTTPFSGATTQTLLSFISTPALRIQHGMMKVYAKYLILMVVLVS
jgi:hypothetical protein